MGISWCVRIPQWPQKGVVCIPEGMKFRGWLESSSSIWTQFLQASGRHFENNTGERNSNQGYKNFELRVMEVIRKSRQERLENKLKGRQLKQQTLSCIFWRIETTLIYYISSAKRIFFDTPRTWILCESTECFWLSILGHRAMALLQCFANLKRLSMRI